MKIRQAVYPAALLGAAVLCGIAPAAQAQTIPWLDRMFTFRENQRPNVQPNRGSQPPVGVNQPYYSPNDHVPWSQFYSRTDLTPQDYMAGSASKVMRPQPENEMAGYQAIAEQALENARTEQAARAEDVPANIHIGEPGEGVGMQAGTGNIGRKTMVGEARQDWRAEGGARMSSRPGDFDYEGGNAAAAGATGGEVLAETAPKFSLPVIIPPEGSANALPTRPASDGTYLDFNDKGEVTRYRVQRGDTLGGIAAQPKIYNDESLWPLIYSANRRAIGGSPNRIAPKMEISIPRDYTEAQAKKARQRAR